MEIDERVTVKCPCCNAVDVDYRHARIYPRSAAQVDQLQPILHAISCTLKRTGVPHAVESGVPFKVDRNLRVDVVEARGGLRDAPDRECREASILMGVTHADPQAHVHLRGGGAIHDAPASSTFEARKRKLYARPEHVSFDKQINHRATFGMKNVGRLGGEGVICIAQLAASVVG